MSRSVAIVASLLALVASAAVAQPAPAPHAVFRIKLVVAFPDSDANLFRSSLAHELRKLDSVEVVNDEVADNKLSVVGTATSSGGFAAAVLLTSKAEVGSSLFFSDKPDCYPTEAQEKEAAETYQGYESVDDLWVFTGHDAPSLAVRIAAAVDVNDVEVHRQRSRRIEEWQKKKKQPKKP